MYCTLNDLFTILTRLLRTKVRQQILELSRMISKLLNPYKPRWAIHRGVSEGTKKRADLDTRRKRTTMMAIVPRKNGVRLASRFN